jgi:hypothetical protein
MTAPRRAVPSNPAPTRESLTLVLMCHDLCASLRISSSRALPNFHCKLSPDTHEHRRKEPQEGIYGSIFGCLAVSFGDEFLHRIRFGLFPEIGHFAFVPTPYQSRPNGGISEIRPRRVYLYAGGLRKRVQKSLLTKTRVAVWTNAPYQNQWTKPVRKLIIHMGHPLPSGAFASPRLLRKVGALPLLRRDARCFAETVRDRTSGAPARRELT